MQRSSIFRKQFWRDALIDIRRSRKDPRARKSLLLRLGILAYFIGVLWYYGGLFYSFHDLATALTMAALLVVMLAIIAAVRFSQWREERQQAAADLASVPRETVAHVQRLAHGLAAVSERALGEAWLCNNTVPEGHTVVSRQISIQSLRSHGAWEEMPVAARECLMLPDGAWPRERTALVLLGGETLNTMLWALSLSSQLRPVNEFLKPLQYKALANALTKPAPGIRPVWDLRVERNTARNFFSRVYAENIHRGSFPAEDDDQREAVEEWMATIAEHPHEDVLAGASTIAELGSSDLARVGRATANRLHTLDLLMALQDGKDVWEELTQATYLSLLIPTTDQTPA